MNSDYICKGCGKKIELTKRKDIIFYITIINGETTHSTKHRVHFNRRCIKLYLEYLKKQFGVEDEA